MSTYKIFYGVPRRVKDVPKRFLQPVFQYYDRGRAISMFDKVFKIEHVLLGYRHEWIRLNQKDELTTKAARYRYDP